MTLAESEVLALRLGVKSLLSASGHTYSQASIARFLEVPVDLVARTEQAAMRKLFRHLTERRRARREVMGSPPTPAELIARQRDRERAGTKGFTP
jgi:hypothetical protein